MIFGDGPRDDPGCPQKTARYDRIHGNTIYGQHFCMLVADEAHVARKYNKVHLAFRGLLERCMAIIAMTATPVTTKPAVSDGARRASGCNINRLTRTSGSWLKF
jgi:hypothetical protein